MADRVTCENCGRRFETYFNAEIDSEEERYCVDCSKLDFDKDEPILIPVPAA